MSLRVRSSKTNPSAVLSIGLALVEELIRCHCLAHLSLPTQHPVELRAEGILDLVGVEGDALLYRHHLQSGQRLAHPYSSRINPRAKMGVKQLLDSSLEKCHPGPVACKKQSEGKM